MIALVCSSCDSGTLWQDDPYDVSWIDTSDNRSLYYRFSDGGGIGRVGPTVVAVGSDEFYVVAKQKNGADEIWFYYVEKSKDNEYFNGSEITEGPFGEKAFLELQSELNLPRFTKFFE